MEGLEGLSANRPRVWGAKLQTLQTLHYANPRRRPMEGLEGVEVNRPDARSEKLRTLQTLHSDPMTCLISPGVTMNRLRRMTSRSPVTPWPGLAFLARDQFAERRCAVSLQ
jgi:hypothetical protein